MKKNDKKLLGIISSFVMIPKILNKNKTKTISKPIIIDVRTLREYNRGHISCSKGPLEIQNKPNNWLKTVLKWTDNNRSKKIIVYCRSGRRSEIAKNILEENGFSNVINGGGFEKNKTKLENYC